MVPISRHKENKLLRDLYYPAVQEVYNTVVEQKFKVLEQRQNIILSLDFE
jgi:hypothetical protein